MKLIKKLFNKLVRLAKEYILRDRNLIALRKWRSVNGDETLRYNYKLNSKSLVFDIGAYKGDFTDDIVKLFDCYVYLFEPVPQYFNYCKDRFKNNPKIKCFNFGLSEQDKHDFISIENDSSTTFRQTKHHQLKIYFKSMKNFFEKHNIKKLV
jgi:FkbM family methyltransferase